MHDNGGAEYGETAVHEQRERAATIGSPVLISHTPLLHVIVETINGSKS